MSEQRQNEPWYAWVFRQVVEKPAAVMAIIGWVAAGYLYADIRTYMGESTLALQALTEKMELNNQEQRLRLDEIIQNTRDLEYWHKRAATEKSNEL